jgi:ribonucleoside-triphosphate reductase (formate)
MSNVKGFAPFVRQLSEGMGVAVAERTILRKKENKTWENWGDVAHRVALGNALLCNTIDREEDFENEYKSLHHHISKATTLMSGRHLQHGDATQIYRTEEIFCNCSTAATNFCKFLLLLSGSGVGRCYDDDMMLVNWDNAPNLRCVLSHEHPDFDWSAHESLRDAQHKYGGDSKNVMWFQVPDSREGWAKALEIWENAAFEKIHKDKLLILDFSLVREKGRPIAGMQNRPASGPVALINAFQKAASLKGSGLDPWRQNLYVDHYFSECVLVGGARRSARMSTKWYKDASIFDFITIKRPIEFIGKTVDEILDIRADYIKRGLPTPMGFLWSSNNSITVDKEFWRLLSIKRGEEEYTSDEARHARKVFRVATEAAYADGTGEPGFINVDKFTQNDSGWEELTKGEWVGSSKYQINEDTGVYLSRLAKKARKRKYTMICNPCSEITLSVLSGFCVIGDVVPFFADTLDEAEDAFRTVTRALIRINTMESIYSTEARRTNRIGVSMTGVHEFAWKFFKVGFRDLINPDFWALKTYQERSGLSMNAVIDQITQTVANKDTYTKYDADIRAAAFWLTLARFNRAVREESITYSNKLGMTVPHTCTTIKPAGSVSKLFGLTEGWHLPPLAWMLRWVQFRHDDPLVEEYKGAGYPWQELRQYSGTVIIGFPTAPTISNLDIGEHLVLAGEATPEEQYKWLTLGEKYWINGVDEEGSPVEENYGNQISYTLKFMPDRVDYKSFKEMLLIYQPQIKCCAIMPQADTAAYEYQPESAITKAEFEKISFGIQKKLSEDISREHVDCANGGCPIDFSDGDKSTL